MSIKDNAGEILASLKEDLADARRLLPNNVEGFRAERLDALEAALCALLSCINNDEKL